MARDGGSNDAKRMKAPQPGDGRVRASSWSLPCERVEYARQGAWRRSSRLQRGNSFSHGLERRGVLLHWVYWQRGLGLDQR